MSWVGQSTWALELADLVLNLRLPPHGCVLGQVPEPLLASICSSAKWGQVWSCCEDAMRKGVGRS